MPIDLAGKPPILLYKDGSSGPSRNPRHMVGAVLVELFAGHMALDTFAWQLQGQHIIHMVDNSAALGSFVKGYCNNCDSIRIVAHFWLRVARRPVTR